MKTPHLRHGCVVVVFSLIASVVAGCGGDNNPSPPATNNNVSGTSIANEAPVANAGPDQNVTTGTLVTLDGVASNDSDGDTITYAWSFDSVPSGSAAALSSLDSPRPSFVADLDGSYVVRLVVNDGAAASAADTVTVTAATGNSAPVANAGTDQNVATGALVALDGSGSSDANGDALIYSWSFDSIPSSSTATLASPASLNPTFIPDLDGSYVIRLTVNDGAVDGLSDTVTVTASTVNVAPVANAGADINASLGDDVTLDGSGSGDANGDPLTYSWTIISKPLGSTATLTSPTAVNPTFFADFMGIYVVSLVVNDGAVNSIADTVAITVSSNALILDGIDDRAQATATLFPDSATPASFTVEAWIHPSVSGSVIASDDAYDLILYQKDGENNSGMGIKFSLYNTASCTTVDAIEFRDVVLNQWNHVAAMYSAEEGAMWLSINGVISPVKTVVAASALCSDSTYQFTVGGFYNKSGSTFAGKIDDVKVSHGVRYTANFTPIVPQLDADTVALWSFDEAQQSKVFAGRGAVNMTLEAINDAHLGSEF